MANGENGQHGVIALSLVEVGVHNSETDGAMNQYHQKMEMIVVVYHMRYEAAAQEAVPVGIFLFRKPSNSGLLIQGNTDLILLVFHVS